MPHVLIAVPSHSGNWVSGTCRSLISELPILNQAGWTVNVMSVDGGALIDDVRDVIAARFLASEADTLFFVDADVNWKPGSLLRILQHPVDCVGGVYPSRMGYPIAFASKITKERDPETGLAVADLLVTGFMKINRGLLERMRERYPELRVKLRGAPDNIAHGFFERMRDPADPEIRLGEDAAFCKRVQAMGETVWADTSIEMGHVGLHEFRGCMDHPPMGDSERTDTIASLVIQNGWTKGAELGVAAGENLAGVLRRCPELHMLAVDLWEEQPENDGPETWTHGWNHAGNMRTALERLQPFADRVRILKGKTTACAADAEDGSLDFVFIDADHSEKGVLADIAAWRSKVRPGGALIFHDRSWPGVQYALDRECQGWRAARGDIAVWFAPSPVLQAAE
jgi:hypothetical protein